MQYTNHHAANSQQTTSSHKIKHSEREVLDQEATKSKGPMKMGSEILVQALIEENVKFVWGYPGGAVLYIYDAFYRQNSIEHILVRHEQGAVHAADGYARATGEVGVALVTSGPGVTNAVTGIATAYMDSIPMVIISGNVPTHAIGQDAFQECDAVGITRPIVKHNFLVKNVQDLAKTLKKAFYLAKTGRPGPVLVDIPKDVSRDVCEYHYPEHVEIRSYKVYQKGHLGQIKKAVQLLQQAKRPYIYIGGGAILSNAHQALNQLVEKTGFPCTNTLMGLGAVSGIHPQNLGMLGMHGTYEANMAMQNCDVLISVGARFDDRVIGNPEHFCSQARKIIHIDIDPSSIAKRVKVDVPIVGDVNNVLEDMLQVIQENNIQFDAEQIKPWWAQIADWKQIDCLRYDESSQLIKPQYVLQKLWDMTNGEAYVCSDVGQHQMWTAQFYKFKYPRQWINSGGLGTMGVGLPYAMGVKKAFPESTVVTITGEGSIQMCIQELSTCLQYDTPVKVISLNNGYLGMVRQWQELEYEERYSHSYMHSLPDFVKLAEAYGHIGIQIERKDQVEQALYDALVTYKDRTVFLDIRTDSSENVWPMVQAGKGISEMLLTGGIPAPSACS
jgi:acetolactate synthase I/II/III large subunit